MNYVLDFNAIWPRVPYLLAGAWLSLQIATSAAHDADGVVGMLGRVDAWLAARIRRELPHVIAALAPRSAAERVVAA